MLIEDEELRNIFKIASEEHLQKLEAGLLHLEKHPYDQARLEEVLREAHTLKGDTKMLGMDEVATLIHQLEGILAAFKRGEIILSAEIGDHLYRGIDAIRKLVHEAVTGEPANVNVLYILAQLLGADIASSNQNLEITQTDSLLFPDEHIQSLAEVVETGRATLVPQILDSFGGYQIEIIRVEPQKLDTLMTQVGELTVTKIRIAHLLVEIEEIVALSEEWSRDALVNRLALDNLERGSHNSALKKVQNFGYQFKPGQYASSTLQTFEIFWHFGVGVSHSCFQR